MRLVEWKTCSIRVYYKSRKLIPVFPSRWPRCNFRPTRTNVLAHKCFGRFWPCRNVDFYLHCDLATEYPFVFSFFAGCYAQLRRRNQNWAKWFLHRPQPPRMLDSVSSNRWPWVLQPSLPTNLFRTLENSQIREVPWGRSSHGGLPATVTITIEYSWVLSPGNSSRWFCDKDSLQTKNVRLDQSSSLKSEAARKLRLSVCYLEIDLLQYLIS